MLKNIDLGLRTAQRDEASAAREELKAERARGFAEGWDDIRQSFEIIASDRRRERSSRPSHDQTQGTGATFAEEIFWGSSERLAELEAQEKAGILVKERIAVVQLLLRDMAAQHAPDA